MLANDWPTVIWCVCYIDVRSVTWPSWDGGRLTHSCPVARTLLRYLATGEARFFCHVYGSDIEISSLGMLFLCLYALLGAKRVHRIIMVTVFTVSSFKHRFAQPDQSEPPILQIMLTVSLALTVTQFLVNLLLRMCTSWAVSFVSPLTSHGQRNQQVPSPSS